MAKTMDRSERQKEMVIRVAGLERDRCDNMFLAMTRIEREKDQFAQSLMT
jgi:hypothetical protein